MDKKRYVAMGEPWEEAPPLKEFKPRCKNLDILDDYRKSGDLEKEYWPKWKKEKYTLRLGSMVNHEALEKAATRLGYKDMRKVRHICKILKDGAPLDIEGEGRMSSRGENNRTVYDYGSRVADSLQAGIEDGYMCGPLTKQEVKSIWPEGVKIAPMMVRLKPNGSVRIIVDMSWPKK